MGVLTIISSIVLIVVIIVAVILCVAAAIIGFNMGIAHRKKIAEAEFGSAEEKAKSIVSEAEKNAQAKKRELMLEAKEEILKQKRVAPKDRKSQLDMLSAAIILEAYLNNNKGV